MRALNKSGGGVPPKKKEYGKMIIRIRKSIRHQMIEFFQNGENSIPLLPSFQQVNFPSFIRRVANEISGAKKVPFDLAFLGVLAGVAVADQGKMRVRMPDGALLSLSVVMLVGAPSGAGKSRALEGGPLHSVRTRRGRDSQI